MLIQDPVFYLLAVPAVLVSGLSKGGFGGGLGILSVPLMALVISPAQAAAIMLPILCLMDLFSTWAFRGRWDRRNLRILLPTALVGTALGTLAFGRLSPDGIRVLLALLVFGFLLYVWQRHRIAAEAQGPSWARGWFWGTLAGFASFLTHAGGPPVSAYLLPQRLDKTVFQATTVLFFLVINYAKLVPYAWLGQLDGSNLLTSLVLLPLAPLGIWLGVFLHGRVSDRFFYRTCYVFLALAGARLLYDGVA